MSMDWNTSVLNVTIRSVLAPGLVDLQKFMFSDKYHLTASTLARVCPSMTGLMLWIASFNRCSMSLLALLNDFLKVRALYFKKNSTISGALQYSACSPPTCTSSTIDLLGVEGSFSDEIGPSRVVWHNCCLAGCIGAFSHFLKCFSKLLAWLMVLPQWGHLSFLMGGSQWCCLRAALFEKNLEQLLHLYLVLSIKHSIWLLNLSHLLISRGKHGFELIKLLHCCWLDLKSKKNPL